MSIEDSMSAGGPVATALSGGPPERKALVVVGMHRSGTSAVARLLSMLGADLPRVVAPALPDNETGFWEPKEIVEAHERLLHDAGSAWDDVSPINESWFATGEARRYEDELLELLELNYSDSTLFVLKDPRICRLVPFWLRVLDRFAATPLFIIPIRDPLAVAESLKRRNDFILDKSLLLWLRHVLEAERATRQHLRTFISYDALLADWKSTLQRALIEVGLELPKLSHETRVEIDRFLSSEHRHHLTAAGAIESDRRIPAPIKRVWAALQDAV